MTSSRKRIACERGGRVHYAEIEIEIDHIKDLREIPEPMGIEKIPACWRLGISYAMALLREKLQGTNPSTGVRVTITSFRGQPVDTSVTAVAYVLFHAIAQEAASQLLEDFRFDEGSGKYIIV